jgi:hypothetical protein
MRIKDSYLKTQRAIEENPEGPIAEEVKQKAANAIYEGIYSEAWVTFMSLFANDPSQLARLTGTDGTIDDAKVSHARAYLVANAVIGLEKVTDTSFIEELETGLPIN